MKWKTFSLVLLLSISLLPVVSIKNDPIQSNNVIFQEDHDNRFRSLAAAEPVVANISMDLNIEINSSSSKMIAAHDAANNPIVVIATKDTIMAVKGASWKYELRFDDGSFDSYNSMTCGDIDADGADEIIVISKGRYMYAVNVEDGSEIFVRSTGIDPIFNKISIADVVGLPGKEIILYSESSSVIYVFSSDGFYLGSIDLPVIDDVEYITSGDINDTYTGDELCVLGYDSSTSDYYFTAFSLVSYPSSYTIVYSPISLGTDFISGANPPVVFGLMYIVNITSETGNEIVFLGTRTYSSPIKLVVFNSSGKLSSFWPAGISVGTSKEWAYAYFYDYNGDSNKEIIIISKQLFSLVKNHSVYSTLNYPADIEMLGGTVYYNPDTSNVSAIMIYYNRSSLTTYTTTVDITNTSYFEILSLDNLYSTEDEPTWYPWYTVFSDAEYYVYSYGRIFHGSASGSTLASAQVEYIYIDVFPAILPNLPNHEFNLVAFSGGWVKIYSSDGTILSQYLSPKGKVNYGPLGYGDYLPGTSGYELALIETYGAEDGHIITYVKIVSGTSVVKEYNITLPQYSLYGVYVATPIPGSSKALIILWNYSASKYNLGIIDLDSGSITIGVELSNVEFMGYQAKIDGTYYYVVYQVGPASKLYLVDTSTAYIVGIKEMGADIEYITVEDIDEDGNDELIVKCDDGFSYYLYVVENDMSSTLIRSANYISDPIVIDIVSDIAGKEIMFSYGAWGSYYLRIYNFPNNKTILDKYVSSTRFYPIMTAPPTIVVDDIVFWMYDTDNEEIRVARLLGSREYTDMEIDLSIVAMYDSYEYRGTIVLQEHIGDLIMAMFGTPKNRFAIFSLSYEIDYERPEIKFSSPYIVSTNITGYIAWNTTLPITVNMLDDYMLSYFEIEASYYDKYGNFIDQDIVSWSLESKNETRNITLEVPSDGASIYLRLTLRDIVGKEKTIEETIMVDREAPTIWPQVPSTIDITRDTEFQISAYIGDDVLLKSVYIQFEGQVIPMKTTEEATPQPHEMYYYTAKVYVKRFNGEKKITIIAEDFVGRISKYEIILRCQIPITEQPLFWAGISVAVIAIIALAVFLLHKKLGLFKRKSEE